MSNKCQAINKTGNNCKLNITNGKYCNKHQNYIDVPHYRTNGITITFGNRGENGVGMQIIGGDIEKGYDLNDIKSIINKLDKLGINSQLYDLKALSGITPEIIKEMDVGELEDAYVLVIKAGVQKLIGKSEVDLYDEHINLNWDTKVKMRGKVVNKLARHNLCYSNIEQEPDYENGKGRIIPFQELPLTSLLKSKLEELTSSKDLVAEGNLYYNINYNGIGFHGDSERKIVIAARLGNEYPFRYRWYCKYNHYGNDIDIDLEAGDIYIMSDKAVGYDWKTKNKWTLRHAAGADEYINPKG